MLVVSASQVARSLFRWILSIKAVLESYRTKHPILDWASFIWNSWLPPNIAVIIVSRARKIVIASSLRGIELAKIFSCGRPLSLSTVNNYWFRPCESRSFSLKFKAALACYGISEIWRAPNASVHDESRPEVRPALIRCAHEIVKLACLNTSTAQMKACLVWIFSLWIGMIWTREVRSIEQGRRTEKFKYWKVFVLNWLSKDMYKQGINTEIYKSSEQRNLSSKFLVVTKVVIELLMKCVWALRSRNQN